MFRRVGEDKTNNLRRIDLLGIQRTLCALDTQVFGSRGHYPVVACVCPDGLVFLPATGVASNLASLNRGTGLWARICAHLWPKRENFALAAWSI